MEEFLGILFCGGRGKRLGEISRYIPKPLIPVYDTPVFKFGLKLLKNSSAVSDIIILTNSDNDKFFRNEGVSTIIQDDSEVDDMFTGWSYIKKKTGTKQNAVLFPGDNICSCSIDDLTKQFTSSDTEFLFMIHRTDNVKKLSEMGSFDPVNKIYSYKNPVSGYGVIAPYIIKNSFNVSSGNEAFCSDKSAFVLHDGIWFDLGDPDSILDAGLWRRKFLNG